MIMQYGTRGKSIGMFNVGRAGRGFLEAYIDRRHGEEGIEGRSELRTAFSSTERNMTRQEKEVRM